MLDTPQITKKFHKRLSEIQPIQKIGRVSKVVGLAIESLGPKARVGELCILKNRNGEAINRCEIVGFKDNKIISMALGDLSDISPGMEICSAGEPLSVNIDNRLMGRILNGLGEPIDGKPPVKSTHRRPVNSMPPNPLLRKRISEPISTGIRAIDGMLTFGKGQRVGIFAGSGVGKSTLLGMIARNTNADINVIALIGERGREVREFIEKDLGKEGLARSIVVVATSDMPGIARIKAALTATAIAEHFRDEGLDVMLMMDSVTRLAMAQREVGLTVGEPPTSKGYTPSVFSLMQKTMERAGTGEHGTITGLYTVLVEGDDFNEPISDTARGILDGHIILSRKIAAMGHYPAIDILESISRVRKDVISKEHNNAAFEIQSILAAYRGAEDLISVGAYQKGSNPKIDRAIRLNDAINDFLKQKTEESVEFDDTVKRIIELAALE
jgi:flagellum-specific ATP synthase